MPSQSTTRRQLIENPDDPSTLLVPLTQGKFAVIDREDADLVERHLWYASRYRTSWYAKRTDLTGRRKSTMALHRELMKAGPGQEVDHINGDSLDCRRANMRFVTHRQNSINTKVRSNFRSGYKGVHPTLNGKRWAAQIFESGKRIHLGTFDDLISAARAYDAAAKERFGEYCRLNLPD